MFPLIGASEPVSSGRPADIYTCGHRVPSVRSDICVQLLPDGSHGNTARNTVPNRGALRLYAHGLGAHLSYFISNYRYDRLPHRA